MGKPFQIVHNYRSIDQTYSVYNFLALHKKGNIKYLRLNDQIWIDRSNTVSGSGMGCFERVDRICASDPQIRICTHVWICRKPLVRQLMSIGFTSSKNFLPLDLVHWLQMSPSRRGRGWCRQSCGQLLSIIVFGRECRTAAICWRETPELGELGMLKQGG